MKLTTVGGLMLFMVAAWMQWGKGGSSPTPAPDLPAPSAEMQALTVPLKAFVGQPNAGIAAEFYRDFAEVLERDTSVTTVGQLRAVHEKAQGLAFPPGPASGMSAAIDAAFVQVTGLEDKGFDRARVVALCRAIAWQLGGGK